MSYEKQNFQDGQVLTAEQLNHIEKWIEKCPQIYVEYGDFVELMPEREAVAIDGGFAFMDTISGVIIGQTYIVKYNGVEYECVAQSFDEGSGVVCILLGNAGLMGGTESQEPFAMVIVPADFVEAFGVGAMFVSADGSESVTVSISGREIVAIKKLDSMFLPDRLNPIVLKIDSSLNVTCDNYSLYEIIQKLNADKTIPILIDNNGNSIKTPISVNVEESYLYVDYTVLDTHNTVYKKLLRVYRIDIRSTGCTIEELISIATNVE